ncbi:hypothetical protein KL86DYS1_10990 [uncultured Dysgonomonas sp.]|uniref:Uncharacterized protein n=1 Tax=uncultured Dysgonomonas sp. TaxID=206096 RepID=A0A212J3A8_9BACT|nr:hypothetical protein KL86DYS1_10990 [uncultured Dysgonomonas sp.]
MNIINGSTITYLIQTLINFSKVDDGNVKSKMLECFPRDFSKKQGPPIIIVPAIRYINAIKLLSVVNTFKSIDKK